jgi:hypothetical protein
MMGGYTKRGCGWGIKSENGRIWVRVGMDFLRTIGRFFKAAGRWGIGLMTGGIFAYSFALFEHLWGHSIPAGLWVTAGTVLFCIGSGLAWRAEEKAKTVAEKRHQDQTPRLSLSVLEPTNWHSQPMEEILFFQIKHANGGRNATHVQLASLISKSGKHRIRFEPVPAVIPPVHQFVKWVVESAKSPEHGVHESNKRFLGIFFNDDAEGYESYELIGEIIYRDVDTECRDCFKLEVERNPLRVRVGYAPRPQ